MENTVRITIYGAYWCPDCQRTKKILGEQFIPYHWVDIEANPAGEALVLAKNNSDNERFMINPLLFNLLPG